jgi:hypothetical protein
VKAATVSGWHWLVEVSNHVGAIALVLLIVGVSAFSAVKLPHWWIGGLILLGAYVLLFAEGAFRIWREAVAAHPPNELPTVTSQILIDQPTFRLTITNNGPGEIANLLINLLVPQSWAIFRPSNENGIAIVRGGLMVYDEPLPGDVPARIWTYREDEVLRPGITFVYFFEFQADPGDYPISLRLYPFGGNDLTVTVDPPGTGSP